jgi:methylglutaconyl-CoA hydratase
MISIEHSRDGRIITVTLNRPERRNALNKSLVLELTRVLRSLDQDDFVRVVLITGTDKTFSAGADLDALAHMADASDEENLEDSRALATLFSTIRSSTKVIIAWVNGHAIAGGSGLATACDLSIAAKSAKFGFTEVRIGFVPALVSVLLKTRLSETQCRDLLLTGRLFKAEEAASMGLITRSVPDAELEEVVMETANAIARNTSPEAIARTKALLAELDSMPFNEAIDHAARANAEARRSEDCLAGVQAFLDKKDAPWIQSWDADHSDPA